MSQKYTGGFITKSPVAPTTTAASGIWTLDQQQQAQKAGTWPSPPIFIEDIFSTYLYTGNGSTQTITNGIDLSGQGGLVWIKNRNGNSFHALSDTASGITNNMASNATGAQNAYSSTVISAATTSGFTLVNNGDTNANTQTYVSWTFRKQPKFFDVVTFSTTNSANARISHNLGSVPACYIIKRIDGAGNWFTYHTSLGRSAYVSLNATNASASSTDCWGTSDPTTTDFGVNEQFFTNGTVGLSYIAYVFASNAGGFPASGAGSTNGISCGSAVIDGGGQATVNLGYEPQWILYKSSTDVQNWYIYDTMRGMPVGTSSGPYSRGLSPNSSVAEFDGAAFAITPTGFKIQTSIAGATYIYVAIRRGPMKTPTVGTSVFLPSTAPATTPFNVGFPPDLALWSVRDSTGNKEASTRLQGGAELFINTTAAESSGLDIGWASKTNFWYQNVSGGSIINWLFRRAPGFCDVVCYTGVGGIATFNHNLTVTPELLIIKRRSASSDWPVLYNFVGSTFNKLYLNLTSSAATNTYTDGAGLGGAPTATTFTVDGTSTFNGAGSTFVAYLFASCPGVSKVGSYTGNGTTQTINCGFTGGARFVLIKQTDASGGWYTYDTARGMTVSTNPYLRINNIAAEIATLGSVTTVSTGFALDSNILPDINFNAGTYIFLAIA